MTGMAKFKRHILYANTINDSQAAYYSAAITKTGIYDRLNSIQGL